LAIATFHDKKESIEFFVKDKKWVKPRSRRNQNGLVLNYALANY